MRALLLLCCVCCPDMLLAPGPAAEAVTPGPLAAGLLQRLKLMGYVPEARCCTKFAV